MDTEVEFEESVNHSCPNNIKCRIRAFECNICFYLSRDPIVTLCGHLFCWPCLYKWLQFHSYRHECPVCKSRLHENKLVPIYGRGTSSSDHRANPLYQDEIPKRPTSQRPQTAPMPELSYFGQDVRGFGFMPMATARIGDLARAALIGLISYVLNFQVHDVRGTSGYGLSDFNYLLSAYAQGGYVHGFHPYRIHVQGTKLVFLAICFLFIGVLVVIMIMALWLF